MNRKATKKICKMYQEKAFYMDRNLQICANLSEKMKALDLYNDCHKLNQAIEDIEYYYINYFSRKNPKKGVEVLKVFARSKNFT